MKGSFPAICHKSCLSGHDNIADVETSVYVTVVQETHWLDKLSVEDLDLIAQKYGFKRKGQRNWIRRTSEFVQLVNLQKCQWSPDIRYLNFALWPLALGEPPAIAESKFQFRTRAEEFKVEDLDAFFSRTDELGTLVQLRDAEATGLAGLMNKTLRALLPQT